MLTKSQRTRILVIALLLFIPVMLLQSWIDPRRHQFEPGSGNTGSAIHQLPIEFALGSLIGLREAVAGLLWVRTDEFFDKGDYEAVTPLIRIITWLDPHQIDVYETGAWHMDYNFTDQDQRSDRRYIPLAIALMNEGIANNTNVPDLYADLGFTHYFRKIGDYPKAAETFAAGEKQLTQVLDKAYKDGNKSIDPQTLTTAAQAVTTDSHGLAHSYENMGQIPAAIQQWKVVLAHHQANIAHKIGDSYAESVGVNVATKNIFENEQRMKWRKTMVNPPVDAKFDCHLVRIAPKEFVCKGTISLIGSKNFVLETGKTEWVPADGIKVEMRLEDAGYKMPVLSSFNLNSIALDPNTTIMQDTKAVHGTTFEKKLDLSRDPEMYSFTAPKYTFTVWFNPASSLDCPLSVSDRIGWLGEGMTDKKYLDTSGKIPGDVSTVIPGLRILKKTFTLTRDDILGNGEKDFD